MGIRQTAQPLGIALGALVIPELAEHGPRAGLMFPAVACAVGAVASAVAIVDPPRKPREAASEQELASPYRGSLVLWRIHAVAGLMMVPQTVTVTFMLVWLIRNLNWSVAAAGVLVTVAQLLSALGRIAVGRWSDQSVRECGRSASSRSARARRFSCWPGPTFSIPASRRR